MPTIMLMIALLGSFYVGGRYVSGSSFIESPFQKLQDSKTAQSHPAHNSTLVCRLWQDAELRKMLVEVSERSNGQVVLIEQVSLV